MVANRQQRAKVQEIITTLYGLRNLAVGCGIDPANIDQCIANRKLQLEAAQVAIEQEDRASRELAKTAVDFGREFKRDVLKQLADESEAKAVTIERQPKARAKWVGAF